MTRLLQILQAVALVVMIALGCLLVRIAYVLQAPVEDTVRDAHVTILEAGLTFKNLRLASKSWKDSSEAQTAAATKSAQQIELDLNHLDDFIIHTDQNINVLLLPQVKDTIAANGAQVASLTAQISGELEHTMADADASLEASAAVLNALNKNLSDPGIPESLENIRLASASLARASDSAADAVVELKSTTTDIRQMADKARETYLKPANLWWGLVKTFLPLAADGAKLVKP